MELTSEMFDWEGTQHAAALSLYVKETIINIEVGDKVSWGAVTLNDFDMGEVLSIDDSNETLIAMGTPMLTIYRISPDHSNTIATYHYVPLNEVTSLCRTRALFLGEDVKEPMWEIIYPRADFLKHLEETQA